MLKTMAWNFELGICTFVCLMSFKTITSKHLCLDKKRVYTGGQTYVI